MIPSLGDYRHLRNRLISDYFEGRNSLSNQLVELVDQGRDFAVINESRFGDSSIKVASRNSIVGGFCDVGFIYSQVFGVSRLTDPYENKEQLRVISLPSLIRELEVNQKLFTRCEFVHSGRYHADMASFWRQHKNRLFDELSGVHENNRSEQDLIDPIIFSVLKRLLNSDEIKSIRLHRDKVLGHSATPVNLSTAKVRFSSNQFVGDQGAVLSLNSIAKAQRAVCWCASIIETCLLWQGSSNYAPTAQYDPFEGLGRGWWDPAHEAKVRSAYEAYSDRRNLWTRHPLKVLQHLKKIWFANQVVNST